MLEMPAIRKCQFLARGIDEGDVVTVNNQTLAYSEKAVIILRNPFGNAPFNLTKLQRKDIFTPVGHCYGRVITIGDNENNCIDRHTHQFGRGCKQ